MARRIAGWVVLLSLGLGASHAAAEQEPDGGAGSAVHARVRTSSPRLKLLLDEGLRLSNTFRSLVGAVLETDGIVFVEEGQCYRGTTACLEWRVTVAGEYRLLFVRMRPGRADDDMIASMGHELQHALEVLRQPGLKTKGDFVALYVPTSRARVPSVVETHAAVKMGDDVLNELRGARSRAAR